MKSPMFPEGTGFTPIPNPLLGPFLTSIEDINELKCILRCIWYIHKKKGPARIVSLSELTNDPILSSLLSPNAIQSAMESATRKGIFAKGLLSSTQQLEPLFAMNTAKDRQSLEKTLSTKNPFEAMVDNDSLLDKASLPQNNIFSLYETNIGMISPLIAEDLMEAEKQYTWSWIEDAFKISVELNKRNWRYISSILDRWSKEGKNGGKLRRHSKKDDHKRYIKEYVTRRGQIPSQQ
jgi:DnaD/phage-associated family protein